jgi:periplasmic divalent cation tolerance protein
MTQIIQVVTTTPSRDEAEKLGRELVARRLAACVQIAGPISSIYHWQGQIESSQEWVCLIKSAKSHFAALEAAIRELHSYAVPEVLAFEATEAAAGYRDWLAGVLAAC